MPYQDSENQYENPSQDCAHGDISHADDNPIWAGMMPSLHIDYTEIHLEISPVMMAAEGEDANTQEMSETNLSPLPSMDSSPQQNPMFEHIATIPMGSLAAHSELVRGAVAQRLHQTSPSCKLVETQFEGGLALTVKIGTQR
jgi:hypothetical protein